MGDIFQPNLCEYFAQNYKIPVKLLPPEITFENICEKNAQVKKKMFSSFFKKKFFFCKNRQLKKSVNVS